MVKHSRAFLIHNMKVANEKKGIFSFNPYNMKKISMRAISRVNVSVKIVSNQLNLKIHIINISNCTLYIVKIFIGFDTLFWLILVDFQNEAASLCVNNSINKDVKWIFIVS